MTLVDSKADELATLDKRDFVLALDRERDRQRITQSGLALACGFGPKYWSEYTSRKVSPKLTTAFRILRVLGIRVTLTARDGQVLWESKEGVP